ncbi:phage tail assembly chaperone [Pseudomonas chlororaphis]|nr:phage tail assembly chaperone [Pseudomonas chlororaphis]
MYAKFNADDMRWMFSFDQVDGGWVEYSDTDHAALFEHLDSALPKFRVIGTGDDGLPEVKDAPELSLLEQKAFARKWRDDVLRQTDGLVARHRDQVDVGTPTTLTVEQFRELLVYRQTLRDWPNSAADGFPAESDRPVTPSILVALLST